MLRCNDHFWNLAQDLHQDQFELFVAGWLGGLAEKVSLGACRGAMIAPIKEDQAWALAVAVRTATEYGLIVHTINRSQRLEIWLICDEKNLDFLERNPDNNVVRGLMCGIPQDKIDMTYVIEAPLHSKES